MVPFEKGDISVLLSLLLGVITVYLFSLPWLIIDPYIARGMGISESLSGFFVGIGSIFSATLLVISLIFLIISMRFRIFLVPAWLIATISVLNLLFAIPLSNAFINMFMSVKEFSSYINVTVFRTLAYALSIAYLFMLSITLYYNIKKLINWD